MGTTPANHLPRSKSITMATSLFRTAPALRAGIRASAAKPMAGMASTSFVRGKATLPDLPYDYGALEPHISGQIMELHHAKHHQTYVNGVNAAIEAIGDAQAKGDAQAAARQAPDRHQRRLWLVRQPQEADQHRAGRHSGLWMGMARQGQVERHPRLGHQDGTGPRVGQPGAPDGH